MKVRRFFLRLLPRLGIFVLSVLLLSVLTFYISRLAPGATRLSPTTATAWKKCPPPSANGLRTSSA